MRIAGVVVVIGLAAAVTAAHAQKGGPVARRPALESSVLTSMPIRELAVFKDGHAFVLHESELPTDEGGDVVLDSLPAPVIGTFWPYSADPQVKLRAVVAGKHRVRSERAALNTWELIQANVGAEVTLTEDNDRPYSARILAVPRCEPKDEPARPAGAAAPQAPAPPIGAPGDVVLLQVHDGVRVVHRERIRDVTFRGEPRPMLESEEWRRLLTLRLDWGDRPAGRQAKVGMVYLQKGVRWIPNYRLDIDGAGKAVVQLQATLINELADFEGATCHLVIGVPTFYFKDTLDPIALQDAVAQLSQYFQSQSGQRLQSAFSNAIMTQHARMGEYQSEDGGPAGAADSDPEITSGSKNEDMFIFEVKNVTLRKGERMVLPVMQFSLPYEDIYTLKLPFAPPPEVQGNVSGEQLAELGRLLRAPKAVHTIRLTNDSKVPLTTAPVIVLRDGRLLAQGLMTYTAVGARTDVTLTTAVDVRVARSDLETKRTPEAEKWDNNYYARADLEGKVSLANYGTKKARIEVTRHVLGAVASASHDAVIERGSVFDNEELRPDWWGWYKWPGWWYRYNGVGRIKWNLELEPNQSVELTYAWYYYWR